MGDNVGLKWVIGVLAVIVVYILYVNSGTTGAVTPTPPGDTLGKPQEGGVVCPTQPTVKLSGVDKYVSSDTMSSTYKFVKNGLSVETDTDGVFNVALGDDLQVLWGHNNGSRYIPILKRYTIDTCFENAITSKDDLLKNLTATIQCFNEEGNPIDDTSENETIGTGEAPTLKCEIRGASKQGLSMGAVMTAEMNGSAYKENDFVITGLGSIPKGSIENFYGDPVIQALGAYSLSSSDNKLRAFEVEPFEGPVVKTFYAYIPAEDAEDPGIAEDITLKLYPVGCYDEEDVTGGALRCGIADLDNTFIISSAGTETIQVD